MAYNSNMPIGTPTPDEELAGAKAALLKAQAFAQEKENSRLGSVVPPPGPMNDPFKPILPQQTAATNKLNAETDLIKGTERRAMEAAGYKKGGPVTGHYTKGTGPVNIGDWKAPMKSRGGR